MGDVAESGSFQRISNIMDTCTTDGVVQAYQQWAQTYDEDVTYADHQGSVMLADQLDKLYPPGQRQGVRILDIGAGTGRVGAELDRRGYTKIDALEPSEEMLDIARARGHYQKYMCAVVADQKLDIQQGAYDVVGSVGAICKGHLPAVAITEMLRLIKNGGFVVIVGAASEWDTVPEYHVKMAGLIKDLQNNGKLQVLMKDVFDGYMFRGTSESINGICIVIKKL